MPKTKKKAFAKSVCKKTYHAHRNSLYPKLHLKKRVTVDIGKFLPDTTVLEMNNLRLEIPKETLLQAISSTATAEVECDVTFDTNDVHAYFTQRKRTLERPLIKKHKEQKKKKKKKMFPDTPDSKLHDVSYIKDYGVDIYTNVPEYTVVWEGKDKITKKQWKNTKEPPTVFHDPKILSDFHEHVKLSNVMVHWRSLHKETYPGAFPGNTVVFAPGQPVPASSVEL